MGIDDKISFLVILKDMLIFSFSGHPHDEVQIPQELREKLQRSIVEAVVRVVETIECD